MEYVIENVGKTVKFWEFMPETYQGFGYEVEGFCSFRGKPKGISFESPS